MGPTKADILTVYAPGSTPDSWPDGMAKLIPAGFDLMFEIHYTPNGKPASDQTRIALLFAKEPPAKRVLTLQLNNDHFRIPAGDKSFEVTAWGSVPNDALCLDFSRTCIYAGSPLYLRSTMGKTAFEHS